MPRIINNSIKNKTGNSKMYRLGPTNTITTKIKIKDSNMNDIESDKTLDNGITSGNILTLANISLLSTKEVVVSTIPFFKKR